MTDPRDWPAPTTPPVASPPPPPPGGGPGWPAPDPVTIDGATPSNAPPPPPLSGSGGGRTRPWWGIGDVLLVIPLTIVVLAVGFVVLAVLASIEGVSLDDLADDTPLPGSMLVIPTLIQQAAWFGWPFVVSRWKGIGPAADWGWAFKPADLGIGLGTAMIGLFAAGAVGAATAAIVDLEDDAAAENTALLTDLEGSPWLWGVIFMVVIGAPFAEEVLFRGLVLRAVAKRWGVVAGVIGSQLTFVPIHFADGGVLVDGRLAITDGQIVLWATIAALGLVLAVVTVRTERLAAAIVAHILINGVGVIGALEVFGEIR